VDGNRLACAAASAWIAASPNMIVVLDWHRGLCGTCGVGRLCAEYREILAEYGAGEYGATVFSPRSG
jgi:hypothetical protein